MVHNDLPMLLFCQSVVQCISVYAWLESELHLYRIYKSVLFLRLLFTLRRTRLMVSNQALGLVLTIFHPNLIWRTESFKYSLIPTAPQRATGKNVARVSTSTQGGLNTGKETTGGICKADG